jgi:hypothetical protein
MTYSDFFAMSGAPAWSDMSVVRLAMPRCAIVAAGAVSAVFAALVLYGPVAVGTIVPHHRHATAGYF